MLDRVVKLLRHLGVDALKRLILGHRGRFVVYRAVSESEIEVSLAQAYFNLGLTYYAINDKTQAMAQYESLKGLDSEMAKQLYDTIKQ